MNRQTPAIDALRNAYTNRVNDAAELLREIYEDEEAGRITSERADQLERDLLRWARWLDANAEPWSRPGPPAEAMHDLLGL